MRNQKKRLLRAAEDLARAAEGLDLRELGSTRERLADSLVLLEYRLRPRPTALELLRLVAGVAAVVGAGAVVWAYRRRLRHQLDELAQSAPHVGHAIVTGREAVVRAVPAAPRAVSRTLSGLIGGDADKAVEESSERA